MPELPEVETVRLGLERRILGRRISSVLTANPLVVRGNAARLSERISGCRVKNVRRKGKTIAIELSPQKSGDSVHLVIRLGMTGQLVASPASAPILPHTHVRIGLEGGKEELRFRDPRRFGMLRCCTDAEAKLVLDSLGPDALEISEEQFNRALEGRRSPIKSWLMNQRMLAGLGNIYADESLFEARIHPLTPAGLLSRGRRHQLFQSIGKVLRAAVRLQGTTFRDYIDIDGNPGSFESMLLAYRRTGRPCRRCGAPIARVIISGRSSHFCPHCQRRPRKAT